MYEIVLSYRYEKAKYLRINRETECILYREWLKTAEKGELRQRYGFKATWVRKLVQDLITGLTGFLGGDSEVKQDQPESVASDS